MKTMSKPHIDSSFVGCGLFLGCVVFLGYIAWGIKSSMDEDEAKKQRGEQAACAANQNHCQLVAKMRAAQPKTYGEAIRVMGGPGDCDCFRWCSCHWYRPNSTLMQPCPPPNDCMAVAYFGPHLNPDAGSINGPKGTAKPEASAPVRLHIEGL